MEDDLPQSFEDFIAAVGQTQGQCLAHSYILLEIVRELARQKSDPHKFLADMFERISARADQGPIDQQGHPVQHEFRWTIETFFKHAGSGF